MNGRSPIRSSRRSDERRRDRRDQHRSRRRSPSPRGNRSRYRDRDRRSPVDRRDRRRSRRSRTRSRSPRRRVVEDSSSSSSPSPTPPVMQQARITIGPLTSTAPAPPSSSMLPTTLRPPPQISQPSTRLARIALPTPPPPLAPVPVPPPAPPYMALVCPTTYTPSHMNGSFPFFMLPPPPPPVPMPDAPLPVPPPPPPPPPLIVTAQLEDQAPGTSEPQNIEPVPLRPIVRDKRILPKMDHNWGHGNITEYEIKESVGEGTYGKVYKAFHLQSRQLVALKKIRLENERDGFPITAVREIKILRQLNHGNVIRLLDIVVERPSPRDPPTAFYLVFEYMAHDLHGIIESRLVNFTEEQIGSLMKQILLGLEHCHAMNFLHRDIKCSNILLNNEGQIKLADFGLARLYQKTVERLYTNRVITLWYRPPELLLGEEQYGPAVDIWSVGCILGELFVKKALFNAQTEPSLLDMIISVCGTPSIHNWPDVDKLPLWKNMALKYYPRQLKDKYSALLPPAPLDLMDKMLTLDPSKRPSATEALSHPWMQSIDMKQVQSLKLPLDQDCHELWSKQQKARRNRQGYNQPSQAVQPTNDVHRNGNTRLSTSSHHGSRRSYV